MKKPADHNGPDGSLRCIRDVTDRAFIAGEWFVSFECGHRRQMPDMGGGTPVAGRCEECACE